MTSSWGKLVLVFSNEQWMSLYYFTERGVAAKMDFCLASRRPGRGRTGQAAEIAVIISTIGGNQGVPGFHWGRAQTLVATAVDSQSRFSPLRPARRWRRVWRILTNQQQILDRLDALAWRLIHQVMPGIRDDSQLAPRRKPGVAGLQPVPTSREFLAQGSGHPGRHVRFAGGKHDQRSIADAPDRSGVLATPVVHRPKTGDEAAKRFNGLR